MRNGLAVALIGLVVFGPPTSIRAATCTVPEPAHPTIQAAVDDPACASIELAAQTFVEDVEIDRSLTVTGVAPAVSIIAGRVHASGAATVVELGELTVDGSHPAVAGCWREAVDVDGGAQVVGSNVLAVNADGTACRIFGDDFETGTTSAWSATVP